MRQKDMLVSILSSYGDEAHVQIPNEIFIKLREIQEINNYSQYSFCYCYLVINSFFYKYNEFLNISKETFISKGDIKVMLGYSEKSKSMDKFIKNNGILEQHSIIKNTNTFPIFTSVTDEVYNNILVTGKINNDNIKDENLINIINKIKPRRVSVSIPKFLYSRPDFDYGTINDYSHTHKILLKDLIYMLYDLDINKSKVTNYFCAYNYLRMKELYYGGKAKISYTNIYNEISISEKYFFELIKELKELKLLQYENRGWSNNLNINTVNEYKTKTLTSKRR